MSKDFIITGNKEIIYVAESIAHEKGLPVDDIITAMENGVKIAAKRKYGHEASIECNIDRKTGNIKLFNVLQIVSDEDAQTVSDKEFISLSRARELYDDSVEIGDEVEIELPPLDLNRVFAQVAREEIARTVKESEKNKEYEAFKNRVGEIVHGVVLKEGVKNVVVGIEGYEAVLHADQMIKGEKFKVGDRVKSYIYDVRRENQGAQIFLSRTDNNFLVKLFVQEVPEIFDGIIEIKNVARDPGSRAKIAVFSKEDTTDVVGACIGIRGARVQAISNELRGEKVDIIKWSNNLAEFVASSLIPAKVNKVIIDEENEVIEVVVANDQLSLAIGRGGQNVRLASKLVDHKIDIMTEEEERERRSDEFSKATKLFMKVLDVEELMAQLLAAEGYYSVEEIADTEVNTLKSIEGFTQEIAEELKSRAEEYLKVHSQTDENVVDTPSVAMDTDKQDITEQSEKTSLNKKSKTVSKEKSNILNKDDDDDLTKNTKTVIKKAKDTSTKKS